MKLLQLIPVLMLLLWPFVSAADKAASSNKKGIESYSQKQYEESVQHFTDALVERPNSAELRYNLGTALSAVKKKEEALNELSIAASNTDNEQLPASAHYNAANTLFLSGDLKEAIEEYKQAVKLDQLSEDIRHNLEIAVRKWQQQQEQQKEQKEKQEDGKKKDENKEEKEDTRDDENKEENRDKQDEKQENKTESSENEEQQDQQQQQSNQQKSEDRPMTLEEAQRILDALSDEEKKALSLRLMRMKTDMRQGDDW